ncbi:MAG: hypothetical protein AAF581_04020 [Planctomycetota bacterium]
MTMQYKKLSIFVAIALVATVACSLQAQDSRPTSKPGGATTKPKPPTTKPASRPASRPATGSTAEQPKPTGPQSTPEGKQLLAQMLAAMGGADKFAAIKNLTWQGGMIRAGQGVEIDIHGVVEFPGEKYRMQQSAGGSQTTFVVTEGGGWQDSSRTGFAQLPDTFVKSFRESLRVATTPILHDWESLVAQRLAPEVVADMEYDVLRVWRGASAPIDFLVNPETHMIERKRTRVASNGAMVLREEKTWDYRVVDGLQFPFHKTITDNGKQVQIINITGYQLNRELPADHFTAPGAQQR